ncbi:hypothetical protein GCM10027275_39170 [Rhabdobacter roseus]|uniref:Uncharacterized protein n=1 Tax=Rhabdobacter roseus TaxID=1655419 RepID=A0A840TVL5_9BACT|nr:hypothetical protein [Rhabdobacter roseus]MBB5285622.1 hypothetical protein [Rhabdobacter roseus]
MQKHEPLAALQEIRQLMDRSSRFHALSGWSGMTVGLIALVGAGVVGWYFNRHGLSYQAIYGPNPNAGAVTFLALTAAAVLVLAAGSAVYFTYLKAQKTKQPVWHSQGRRLVINLCIPMAAGGLFCLALYYHGLLYLVAPSMLLFYGLALINSSKYTFDEIRYLGIFETVLGLLACFFVAHGLLAWTLGFGALHVAYGALIYYKYEKAGMR